MWSSNVVPGVDLATGQQYNRLRADAKGAASFLVHQTEPASMDVIVEGGTFQAGTQNIQVPTATTLSITPTTAQNKRVAIYLNNSGSIFTLDGVEGVTPTKPNIGSSYMLLAYVYVKYNSLFIYDSDTGAGYIVD